MKRVLLFVSWAVANALVSLACSDSAPPVSSPSSSDNYVPSEADSKTDGAATEPQDASDADVVADASTDAPAGWVPGPSVCNPKMSVGSVETPVETSGDVRFGSISLDEGTIAWTVTSAGTTTVHVADRSALSQPFGAPHSLSVNVADDGLALSPDGLWLVAVAEDRRSFVAFERESREATFVEASDKAYEALSSALEADEKLGDPVFAFGDLVFIYSVYGQDLDTVRYATRLSSGSSFDSGGALAFPELRAQGALRRRPTGVGSDFQTLFFWDEVTQSEKLGRLFGTTEFGSVVDLGARPWAQPNQACNRIYYGAGSELFRATVN